MPWFRRLGKDQGHGEQRQDPVSPSQPSVSRQVQELRSAVETAFPEYTVFVDYSDEGAGFVTVVFMGPKGHMLGGMPFDNAIDAIDRAYLLAKSKTQLPIRVSATPDDSGDCPREDFPFEDWSTGGEVRHWLTGGVCRAGASKMASIIGLPEGYFESSPPAGDARCSDDECPCEAPGTPIRHGEGYLYVSPSAVEFRTDCPSADAVEAKLYRIKADALAAGSAVIFASGTIGPILMCEQGAQKRHLNLDVAAADAKHWWETGFVPLRPTPIAE
jgi:hypothetical protein